MAHRETKPKDPLRPPAQGDGPRLVAWLALRRFQESPSAGGAQELLAELGRRARLSPRDRALAFEMMQGVWRARSLLDEAIARLEGFRKAAIAPPLRALLRLGAQQHFLLDRVPPHALVNETVEVARRRLGARQAGFCNAALKRLVGQYSRGRADLETLAEGLPREKRHSFPQWIARTVKRAVGADHLDAALEALNRPLPIHARSNPLVATPERAARQLERQGIQVALRPDLAPLCMEVQGPAGPLAETKIFREGGITIQDASAQLVSELADARPGMRAIDYCAAPGGKTAYLAAAMEKTGRLIAFDAAPGRLERLKENLARMQVGEFVEVRLLEGASRDGRELLEEIDLGEGADRVLVDVPCSGLGTLRRHPEIRWRLHKSELDRLARAQGEILDRAAPLVRPGGRLVYATCSLALEENQSVVDAFLERTNGDFEILTAEKGPDDPALARRFDKSGWLIIEPHLEEMDSARAVILQRVRS